MGWSSLVNSYLLGAKSYVYNPTHNTFGKSKMDAPSMAGVLAVYELVPGCRWTCLCNECSLALFAQSGFLQYMGAISLGMNATCVGLARFRIQRKASVSNLSIVMNE